MPRFYVRTCNSNLAAVDEGDSYDLAEDALKAGIDCAVSVASEEIRDGQRTAAVDVCVEDADHKALLRSVVSVSVSPLMVNPGWANSDGRPNHADND